MVSTSTRKSDALSRAGDGGRERRVRVLRRARACIFVPDRSAAPNGTGRLTTHRTISSWWARCNGARPSGSETTRKIEGRGEITPWSGEASLNPFNVWGKADPVFAMGGLGLCGRRRQRPMALAGQDQLSRCRAAWRRRRAASSFLATWAAIFMRSTPIRPRILGRKDRRRDWRRRHHLHHAAGTTRRRRDRPHRNPVADGDNDSQGFDPGPRQELSVLLVALPLLTRHGTGEGEQFTLHAPHSPRAAQN